VVQQAELNLDFLAANVHGRRSRMVEADRLERLLRLRTVPDLARALVPEAGEVVRGADLERRLVLRLAEDLTAVVSMAGGLRGGALLAWLPVRLQVENLKVLARGMVRRLPAEAVRPHLVPVPGLPLPEPEAAVRAEGLEGFSALVPQEPLREGLARAEALWRETGAPLAIEAGLDAGYLAELLRRADAAPDRAHVRAVVGQEAAGFELMLAVRGRFVHGLKAEVLRPLAVRPAGMERLLRAADPAEAARAALGRAIDRLPRTVPGTDRGRREPPGPAEGAGDTVDLADLEALVWDRYWRVASGVFRRSHMGLGAVVAYAALRRVELANLIRVVEAVRLGLDAAAVRPHLVPRARPGEPSAGGGA